MKTTIMVSASLLYLGSLCAGGGYTNTNVPPRIAQKIELAAMFTRHDTNRELQEIRTRLWQEANGYVRDKEKMEMFENWLSKKIQDHYETSTGVGPLDP